MVVEYQVRQVPVPSISDVLTPQMLSAMTLSIQIWPCHHPWSVGSGPKQYDKSQHESAIEVGKAKEAAKLGQCCWSGPVLNDLDLGRIDMHPMLIYNVSEILNPCHAK